MLSSDCGNSTIMYETEVVVEEALVSAHYEVEGIYQSLDQA